MKLGIVGLLHSGKTTVFEALTHQSESATHKGEGRLGTVNVPDSRLDYLRDMYEPKKQIYAQISYLLPGKHSQKKDSDKSAINQIRDCDALIHVIRNFKTYGAEKPNPRQNFIELNQELILTDLAVVEPRLERLHLEKKQGRTIDEKEISLLTECLRHLEDEVPLRKHPELPSADILKGYAFISSKPMLVLFNNDDDDNRLPDIKKMNSNETCMAVRGRLEQEIVQIPEEEKQDFLAEFDIAESAMDRVIRESYELLGLISFFTVGKDEVRAWTIKKDSTALDAAGAIHTDFQKGFIRAEVVSFDDLTNAGSHQEAKKKGTVRLEGKTYIVQDGDVIEFRFNV
ncbi:MAG: redox-regulated ATPase YchF [Deltaproteobacteria bacterium]|nr:redox-regulated ATPase YchF [Deltaproteobacteria bacterium]MBW2180400.1 redox-regulated ATPase YchF [Deltaproteobacteria bacterium]MBW2364586.1 redox-regulated ATPase YchF [Deltaproteobacteria bacterium]